MLVYVNRLALAIGGSYLSGNDLQDNLQPWGHVERLLLVDPKWITSRMNQIPALQKHKLVITELWNVESQPCEQEVLRVGDLLLQQVALLGGEEPLVVILGQDSLVWLVSYLKKKKSDLRIATFHQGTPTHVLNELSKTFEQAFLKELRDADFVLTVSRSLSGLLSPHFTKSIITIPNLPRVPATQRTRRNVGLKTTLQILQVSSYKPRKRTLDGMSLLKSLNERGVSAELTYVGGGGKCNEFLTHSGPNLRITAIPFVPRDTILQMMSTHDILFVPSRKEGFPRIVVEALAVGTPVLISTDANACGVISDNENGLVFETGNINDATSKVLFYLSSNDELRARFFQSGRNTIKSLLGERQNAVNELVRAIHSYRPAWPDTRLQKKPREVRN